MSATVAVVKKAKELNEYTVIADITLDNNYQTGGYALTPQQFGLSTIDAIKVNNPGGYGFYYDNVNKKLKVYVCGAAGSPMQEAAAAADLHTVVARVVAYGI